MNPTSLATARSLLFVPGHRQDRFAKALATDAGGVILDLEDAVAPQDKAAAREHVRAFVQQAQPVQRARLLVRINPFDSPEHTGDLQALRSLREHPLGGVVLPKASDVSTLAAVAEAAGPGVALLPLIESAEGWAQVDALARAPGVLRLVFGHLDFQLDMGMAAGEAQTELMPVRLALVAASRRAGLAPPVDGVTPDVGNAVACDTDTRRAQRLGFGGKLCIHPSQVALVHAAFAPSVAERDWAQRVLAANDTAQGAVFQFEGRMVDAPVLARARRLLLP
ncbi:MAG: CoA ester lyase [Betaproteobacteria bacterium HGW-Betaproteobacteria-16]|nr:MAG: CoA ester lyase [Betaproteobacteria bacterium HGW-Betaproteobacteria-16]